MVNNACIPSFFGVAKVSNASQTQVVQAIVCPHLEHGFHVIDRDGAGRILRMVFPQLFPLLFILPPSPVGHVNGWIIHHRNDLDRHPELCSFLPAHIKGKVKHTEIVPDSAYWDTSV